MTLSFKSALLPSMLAISLALGACQDPSASIGENVEAMNADIPAEIENEKTTVTVDKAGEISAEEQMIANLARYRWTLLDIDDKSGGPVITKLVDIKNQVTLLFKQNQGHNTVNYGVGCNTISTGYQLQGHTLTTKESMSTKMLCENLNKAENRLDTLMQGTSELSVTEGENPVLTQVTSNAITLTWKGRLTSQAKYNSKGETLFWAVNATMLPCTAGSSKICLQVKPITYDDQGIKTSEGEWSAFNGEIDGYEYDGKHNEVLRLQRYQLDSDQISEDEEYAYVLDAVIESSVVE
ncbi:MAG TPA: META domain-containing protein [Psychrobacter sp.]|uniref:META domain-containing protein n=1 Tax=Psychrobacter sp. TaxID=56811 RepID=UPI002CF2051C|nr:META domain-containing protein [Psychrobacter sp.]HSP84743.1 META domain-containing protein [Psychrobacter sp.]